MKNFVKSTVRRILPENMVLAYRNFQRNRLNRRYQHLTTEEVFTDIYSKGIWGGQSEAFFSGSGSHATAIVLPYISKVTAEFEQIGAASMTVVDLGCGDYSVSGQLTPWCGRYIGIDIVKPLVAHNEATFGNRKVSFCHSNIVDDPLPDGDICLVRQVFQHLSNRQIEAVLPKLNKFRWSFITEHHPSPGRVQEPNSDKPQGDNIRVSRGSGVFLDKPPFNISSDRYRLLLEVPGIRRVNDIDPGIIRTYVLQGDNSSRENDVSYSN